MGIREVVVVKRRARGRGEGWTLGRVRGKEEVGRMGPRHSALYIRAHGRCIGMGSLSEYPWETIL